MMLCIAGVIVGRDGSHGKSNALGFSEQRHKKDCRKNGALRGNGNNQRSAANAVLASALLQVAFDETAC
jgi:hypothetical protein